MKKFFRKYPDIILVCLAAFLLGIIFWSFSWGVGQVVGEVNRAVNAKGAGGGSVNFNLKDAQNLDLRGLVKP